MPHRSRRRLAAVACVLGVSALVTASVTTAADEGAAPSERTYVVLYEEGADAAAARAQIESAGGRVVAENADVGVATVRSASSDFVGAVRSRPGLKGAALQRAIGRAPGDRPKRDAVDAPQRSAPGDRHGGKPRPHGGKAPSPEPLADRQWDMAAIDADTDGSYRVQQGDRKVRVGIIDTGVDGSHPDIAPNFNGRLSRNFTVDDPLVDGECADDPDGSCEDPADVDEDGHGTHVAGTIGSPLNGLGIAGVAPRVELVNLRAGQDSGYFFLQPTVDALTYAAQNGVDVVNMSFYIDPWLFNCTANPADSAAEQEQQRTIIEATQRALRYARSRGVTLVGAAGNQYMDLGKPVTDTSSPDYPPDSERTRTIDNSCLTLPAEGDGTIAVTSVAPSGRKAYYSSYGIEQADVAAPGGDTRDNPTGTRTAETGVLAPYPESLARQDPRVGPDGVPVDPFVVRDCQKGRCAYYQYLQGTSMASPHAAGVAALIVSQYGRKHRGDVGLDPRVTERVLLGTAVDTPCPTPPTQTYPGLPNAEQYTATCEGTASRNGFFGEGVVNALRAVTAGH